MFSKFSTAKDVMNGVNLSGKTVVITGASGGLGKESAKYLAKAGAQIFLLGRNKKIYLQYKKKLLVNRITSRYL